MARRDTILFVINNGQELSELTTPRSSSAAPSSRANASPSQVLKRQLRRCVNPSALDSAAAENTNNTTISPTPTVTTTGIGTTATTTPTSAASTVRPPCCGSRFISPASINSDSNTNNPKNRRGSEVECLVRESSLPDIRYVCPLSGKHRLSDFPCRSGWQREAGFGQGVLYETQRGHGSYRELLRELRSLR